MPAHTIAATPPWGTLFTMLTSANRSPTRHLSAICPLQLKPGLVREVHTSPACQWPFKVNHFPTELQSGQDPSEDNEHADELT